MRFGLFGGPVVPEGASERDVYEEYVAYAIEAEKLGFDGIFLTEHHFTGLGQTSSPLTLLTFIAARTSSIRLGTAVAVLPWYNPITLAETAATLDLLSDGRLDFGVGRGFRAKEFEGFGIDMGEAEDRYEEALDVILKSWRTEGRWSHAGERWRYENVLVEPETEQRPHPPIWMAAGSPPGLRTAAERDFKLLLDQVGDFKTTGERISCYRERRQELGRPYAPTDVAVARSLHIVDSAAERRAAIEQRAEVYARISALANTKSGPQNRMAAAMAANTACAGFAPERQLSVRSGHNIQQPECRSNSAGMRKPSFAGVDVSVRNAGLRSRMLALRLHLKER